MENKNNNLGKKDFIKVYFEMYSKPWGWNGVGVMVAQSFAE